MSSIVWVRNFALVSVLGSMLALAAPSGSESLRACRLSDTRAFRSIADRYRGQRDYANAARWYEAAAKSSAGCSAAKDRVLHARSLVQAGAAAAEVGDYLRALSLVREAQSRLRTIVAERKDDAGAQPYLELADDLISAINTVASASM